MKARAATIWFITCIVGARIAMGIFMSITGPTLPTLASNVDKTVATVSWIFTARSFSFFVGAACATPSFKYFDPLLAVTVCVWGIAICLVFIPIVVDFWLLIILILLPGLFAGFLDAGIQAILLQVWGPTKSRPLIQSFHFMYTIGAFLAPIIIAPFIEKANEDGSVEAPCPGEEEESNVEQNEEGKKYIFYGYLVPAIMIAIVGCGWIFITFVKVLDPIRENNSDESDNRKEEKTTTIWSFLLGIFLYFFTIESSEVIYSTYIYDYARCSVNLDLDSSDGTTLNAIFWGTMMGGRAVGIILAKYLTPTVYAAIDLIVCVFAVGLMAIPQILGKQLVYASTAIFGFAMSTVYGNAINFVSKRMNLSGSVQKY